MLHADTAYFVAVVCLPLLVRLLMVPWIGGPVRAWSQSVGERLWTHLAEREEPSEEVLRRWALVRLAELERNLARVRHLVATDDDMSATRQLGNRLAYARLTVDVAAAFAAAPERVLEPPNPAWQHTWQPTSVRYLPAPASAVTSRVEILEF